jgi:GNAT superfamily N-acetyltransferase
VTTITTVITTLDTEDENRALATLSLAFSDDPFIRWMFPDAHQYLTYFPAFVRTFGGPAFGHGTAHCANAYEGIALWLPPGAEVADEEVGAVLERAVRQEDQADLAVLLEQALACHPTYPHWYLPLIGVDPTGQGRGLGSALLEYALRTADEQRMPAYLESSNERNIPLYERHGFKVVGKIQAGGSAPLWPMLRDAR